MSSYYGPQLPPGMKHKSEEEDQVYGPKRPGRTRSDSGDPAVDDVTGLGETDSDEGEAVIGPMPPKQGQEADAAAAVAIASRIEQRAEKMRAKIQGTDGDSSAAVKRESWMLELPPELSKNFGLGARGFRQKMGPASGQDKTWAEAPGDKEKRQRGEVQEEKKPCGQDTDVLEYMASLKRDAEMQKVAEKLSQKRGTHSLMELHTKKLKTERSEKKTEERRPFDREVDLQVNHFDAAQKEAMLKRARQLNDRFSSGDKKFL